MWDLTVTVFFPPGGRFGLHLAMPVPLLSHGYRHVLTDAAPSSQPRTIEAPTALAPPLGSVQVRGATLAHVRGSFRFTMTASTVARYR